MHLLETSGEESYDRLAFTHCRQFHAESAIRFDADSGNKASVPIPNSSAAVGLSSESEAKLPGGLRITLELTSPISESDDVGSLIHGRTCGEVRRKGKGIIPNGSTVQGRIRRLERFDESKNYFVVELEFTEIDIGGVRMRFYADLQKLEGGLGGKQTVATHLSRQYVPRGIMRELDLQLPQLVSVASLLIPGKSVSLPEDFRMVWKTRDF